MDEAVSYFEDYISIHAPRAGCDTTPAKSSLSFFLFQSTHPVRGATVCRVCSTSSMLFQSTHPVRGATTTERPVVATSRVFQSTHPVRGATKPSRTARRA